MCLSELIIIVIYFFCESLSELTNSIIPHLLQSKQGMIFLPWTSHPQFLHKHPGVIYNTTSCTQGFGLYS